MVVLIAAKKMNPKVEQPEYVHQKIRDDNDYAQVNAGDNDNAELEVDDGR